MPSAFAPASGARMPSAFASASAPRMPSASASASASAPRMLSASGGAAALALYDSPAPPFVSPLSTRAMTKLAGYGALGPLAATCIGSAALVVRAVSTSLVAGEKPTSANLLHHDASSTSCALAPILQYAGLCFQAREVLEGHMLLHPDASFTSCTLPPILQYASLCLQGREVVDGLHPDASSTSCMLLPIPQYACLCLQAGEVVDGHRLLANILISKQAEEMLPIAATWPLGLRSTSSTIRRGGWGMLFSGAPPSGQHLLRGAPHQRLSYLFAAHGCGAPCRGYATATEGGINENVKTDEKIENLSRRLHIVEKAQEDMLRKRRNGRIVLIGVLGVGAAVWNIYGDDLLKKGDKSISDFMTPRLKGALLGEATWSNFSAVMNHITYGVIGLSKEQQLIRQQEAEAMKKAKEELAREVEQKKADWYKRKREKEERFNQSRPADEHALFRYIAWLRFCMQDEEYGSELAEYRRAQELAAIRARVIKNHELKEEKKKKREEEKMEEEEEKKREEMDVQRRKNQCLAEIRARAIRNGEKREK